MYIAFDLLPNFTCLTLSKENLSGVQTAYIGVLMEMLKIMKNGDSL